MTLSQYKIYLEKWIFNKYRTRKAAAIAWGISPAYVSKVLNTDVKPADIMLDDTGHNYKERIVGTVTKRKPA